MAAGNGTDGAARLGDRGSGRAPDVAGYNRGSDPRRADATSVQAGLLEACARH